MKEAWKIAKVLMAVLGFVLMYAAISTSDYYIIEMGQMEPPHVWAFIWLGLALMVPAVVSIVISAFKGWKENGDLSNR